MWVYKDSARLATMSSMGAKSCIYCRHAMHTMDSMEFESDEQCLLVQFSICLRCGWWHVYRVHQGEYPRTRDYCESYSGAIGSLKELDLEDLSAPLAEVRLHLLAKRDSLFKVHPRLLEDVVCSVFKAFGWDAYVTAYSGDDGVDVILKSASGKTTGVQVKRYKDSLKIEAEQIRSLAGAMLLGGHTKGVFVTTSSFRKGARCAADRYTAIGHPIELVDADRFLDALGLAHSKDLPISEDRIIAHMLSPGIRLGTGLLKVHEPGEDLTKREIAGQIWTRQELIDLSDEASLVAETDSELQRQYAT